MSSYTNVFSGTTINPAFPSYAEIELVTDVTNLTWPTVYAQGAYSVAYNMSVESNDDDYQLRMPPANQTSVGQRLVIGNIGTDNFILSDTSGNEIVTIQATQVYFIILADNSDEDGTWQAILLGATTAEANASALQGFGLITLNNKLNTNVPTTILNNSPAGGVTSTDRGKLFIWKGGTEGITLPDISAVGVGNGFVFSINNASTIGGIVTLNPQAGQLIDGLTSLAINLTETGQVISGTDGWYTVGFGRTVTNSISLLEINATSGGTRNLTQLEAQNQILRIVGTPASNFTLTVPDILNYWFVQNLCTGPNTVAFKLESDLGAGTLIPQTARIEFYGDGTNVQTVPNYIKGSFSFNDGSAAAPSISFASDSTTGGYKIANGQIGWSTSGTLTFAMIPQGVLTLAGTTGLPSFSFIGEPTTGFSKSAVGVVSFSSQAVEKLEFFDNGIAAIAGSSAEPSYTFIGDTATGLARTAASTVAVIGNATEIASFAPTAISVIDNTNIEGITGGDAAGIIKINPENGGYLDAAGVGIYQGAASIASTTAAGVCAHYNSSSTNYRLVTEENIATKPMLYSDYLEIIR